MSRAYRSFWLLLAATILAAGILAQALASPASTSADVIVAVSALVLTVSALLLARVLRHLTRAPDRATTTGRSDGADRNR